MPWHLYFHVWEIDRDQPRISAIPFRERIRQYRNLDSMRDRIARYLETYEFKPIAEKLGLAEPEAITVRQPVPTIASDAEPLILRTPVAPLPDAVPATIVIPCYNEEASLPYLARTLASFQAKGPQYRFSYVFVDDGSKDDTWSVLHTLFGDRDDCKLIQHARNSGIAAATMTGIRAAEDEIVCGIDCDCSFDPHRLADMIPLLTADVDLVQASPYHPQGGSPMSRAGVWLCRGICRASIAACSIMPFTATPPASRVYRASAVRDLQLDDGGFLGIAEIFIRLDQSGAKMVRVPGGAGNPGCSVRPR